jgi:ParB/RepB/Spo0J family partition protein
MSKIHDVEIDQIQESKTNPRSQFFGIEDLAASIKQDGVLQPVLVRLAAPQAGLPKFELVAGARRLRAAKIAGLSQLPAIIRTLTDEEVLNIQLIENIQRADMHPMDEAEALEKLTKSAPASSQSVPAAAVAKALGKSISFVQRRLVLCRLPKDMRLAFRSGKIGLEAAMAIARIGDEPSRKEAAKEIMRYVNAGELSAREVINITEEHTRELAKAPFSVKDLDLLPKAGACTSCPKRTGSLPDLFSDMGKADRCTDGVCYKLKVAADYDKKLAEAKAKGWKVMNKADAEKTFSRWSDSAHGNYVNPMDRHYGGGKSKAYSQAVGKDRPEFVLAKHPHTGAAVLVWPKKAVDAAIRKNSPGKPKPSPDKQAKLERQKAKAERELDARVNEMLMLEIESASNIESPSFNQTNVLRAAVIATAAYPGGLLVGDHKVTIKEIMTYGDHALAAMLLQFATSDFDPHHSGLTQDFLEQTAAALGADPKAIRAQAKAGMK